MAFGDSARKAKEVSDNRTSAVNTGVEPIYFPIVDGSNFFRLFPNDDVVMFREWWFDIAVFTKDKDGNEKYEVKSRPAILSVFNPETGYYDAAESGQDPLSEWYYAKTEDERKALKKFIRTRFAVNIVNRNLVKKNEDGTFIPHQDGEPLNSVQILTHSGGKEGGKHVLQSIMDCVGDMRNARGKQIAAHMSDLLIRRAGSGFDTRYAISVGYNQEEIDFDSFTKYDLESFYKPFPFDALRDMMEGEKDWNTIKEEYNIPQWPQKYNTIRNIPTTLENDGDLPF